MKLSSVFWFDLKPNADLRLFLIDPEYEIFIPMFMWPQAPAFDQIRKGDSINEFRVQQHILIKNTKGCMSRAHYSSKYFVQLCCFIHFLNKLLQNYL